MSSQPKSHTGQSAYQQLPESGMSPPPRAGDRWLLELLNTVITEHTQAVTTGYSLHM